VRKLLLLAVAIAGLATAAPADETYFDVPVRDLEILDGTLPKPLASSAGWWAAHDWLAPRIVLDGAGEAYVDITSTGTDPGATGFADARVRVRVPTPGDVTGLLVLPQLDERRMVKARFRIPAAFADAGSKRMFVELKIRHCRERLDSGAAGAAWFRHQILTEGAEPGTPTAPPRRRDEDLVDTYALFTGSRALSENLQLDRGLRGAERAEPTIDVDSIAGVTVAEIDWSPYLACVESRPDPLALFVPEDQLAFFFPSFDAMLALMDLAEQSGTPILHAIEARTEDAKTRARYERQLCLRTDALARALGPTLISAVAFTAGDPFLRTGSDVAVLFEAKDVTALSALLKMRRAAAAAASGVEGVTTVTGDVAGVPFDGLVSPARRVSSYMATLGTTVVLTNSLVQLERVLRAGQEKAPSLAGRPEYVFFRGRYPRGGEDDTGLLVLPDPAIRRWCSARWRIGESRRVRADATLAELEAANAEAIARPGSGEIRLDASWAPVDLGRVRQSTGGIQSDIYNTRDFLTPVAELEFQSVTEAEARAYERWRDGYQRYWTTYFDPVAVRFTVEGGRVAADATIMPLIATSDYRDFSAVVIGAKLAPGAGDPHPEALLHFALALNTKSEKVREADQFLGMLVGGTVSPLAWMGGTIAIYVDRDPFWEDAAKAEDPEQFFEDNVHRLPVALNVDVKDPVKCAVFLSILRAFVQRSAPGMVEWENRKHGEQEYVRIGPTAQLRAQTTEMEKAALYYATMPDALIITLSEAVLKRALDRRAPHPEGADGPAAPPRWLGDHVGLFADRGLIEVMDHLAGPDDSFASHLRHASWSNLPILNVWKRLFPEADPVAVHEKVFGVRLVCPGGGTYVWNAAWRTMESTAYGHPGEPKDGPEDVLPFAGWRCGRFGLTFEKEGLRAACELQKE